MTALEFNLVQKFTVGPNKSSVADVNDAASSTLTIVSQR